jgi:hypothetical protein
MQLYVLISIFVLVFIAFSIGLNLGLHGVLNSENSVKIPSLKTKNNVNTYAKVNELYFFLNYDYIIVKSIFY